MAISATLKVFESNKYYRFILIERHVLPILNPKSGKIFKIAIIGEVDKQGNIIKIGNENIN